MMKVRKLLSLPAGSASRFAELDPYRARDLFVTSDPPGQQIGSGGGTVHLLWKAWREDRTANRRAPATLEGWLNSARTLIVHGSGESRRLPPYAALGKPLAPVPVSRGFCGQQPDQLLLDLQMQAYEQLLRHAPPSYRAVVTCGDVLLRHGDCLPVYPEVDVLIAGLAASPEEAQQHGVMICPSSGPALLERFLQKPHPSMLPRAGSGEIFYLDTGVWFLSERAVSILLRKCQWMPKRQRFRGRTAGAYDLYASFGPALGRHPAKHDRDIAPLTCAVLPLPDGRFYHFGTNRSLLTSVNQLQHPSHDQRSFGHGTAEQAGMPVLQHADVQAPLEKNARQIWIENSTIGPRWKLRGRNVLTGVPPNDWALDLPSGACLDFVPVRGNRLCLRAYGFDDVFKGPVGTRATSWFNRPAAEWFARRGLDPRAAGVMPKDDIQTAPLFPVFRPTQWSDAFLQWMLDTDPADAEQHRLTWLRAPRLSARELLRKADVLGLYRRRRRHMRTACERLPAARWSKQIGRLDLQAAAALYAGEGWRLPGKAIASSPGDLAPVHDHMFRAATARLQRKQTAKRLEATAFKLLRNVIVREMDVPPVQPTRNVMDDQIVWGRSPIRLDLAGGWTDTPPYCLEHGGRVVNVAVDLNGQPPIQVFARLCERPEIVMRSIDLGVHERIQTYEQVGGQVQLGSGFGIARAALSLAGLHPSFHHRNGARSLKEQLKKELGGGIELSMLAAIPKGSGLGTSSILAATLLGTLSELLGLHWTINDLFIRTLALEQMLTSGGGWQDQAGGITPSLKIIETTPGLSQKPVYRWLPDAFFAPEHTNADVLLYYTGITRVAHDILSEIVRGLFLNSGSHLRLIQDIGFNAAFAADALQRNDRSMLCEAIRRSWQLNQLLDSGTNPPPVQSIVSRIEPYMSACKLLGAGGGGYMLILAKDTEAAGRIRKTLTAKPPNSRARFVDLSLSKTGFQVTRS